MSRRRYVGVIWGIFIFIFIQDSSCYCCSSMFRWEKFEFFMVFFFSVDFGLGLGILWLCFLNKGSS